MTARVTPADLGLDLVHGGEPARFQWLVASFLMGKRIRATVAMKTFDCLRAAGVLADARTLHGTEHRQLVRVLGQGGYARYDESTARRLHALALRLEQVHAGSVSQLIDDPASLMPKLMAFEGIGAKTATIFIEGLGVGERP
ncbi:DNA methylase [Pseudomonas entomophila]|uniref:DNA methylase n=1 Tax=Pseudomonas entomophila TaxID=312306 RepID=UPI0015E44253|nr:DNA methylase [Pseudomonas entomophila]MBA1188071.1 DNA methylase [Pseudomonas entomophila]